MPNGRSRWRSWKSSRGDGKTVTKQVISATDMQAFGTRKLVDSVRCDREEVGPIRHVGCRRQRRFHTAAVADGRRHDELARVSVLYVVSAFRRTLILVRLKAGHYVQFNNFPSLEAALSHRSLPGRSRRPR